MARKRVKSKTGPLERFESGNYEPPTPEQVRELVEGMEMTQTAGAKITGVNLRTFTRWLEDNEAGRSSIPYAAWTLLLYHANYDIGERWCLYD